MSNDDLRNKFFDKLDDLLLAVRDHQSGDEDIKRKIKTLNMYISQWNLDGINPLDEASIFRLRKEIQPFYVRLMNEIKTEAELKEEYDNLSDPVQEIYSWYSVLSDWENRQESLAMYEDYLSISNKPYFTEEELRKAYDKSVDRPIYGDDNRIQFLSWGDFRKQYESKILRSGFIIEERVSNVSFNMLACLAGVFIMGHHQDQKNNPPRYEIIERSFLLGETEVTQELYEAVMGTNPSEFKNNPKNPVENVTWGEAIDFCNKLSKLQGLDQCYTKNSKSTAYGWDCDFSKNGYRLPTEKEWEYAAKAGTNNQWAGTDDDNDLGNYAWFGEDLLTVSTHHPVAKKLPNEWGFYDMSGNVWEWCWDEYKPKDPDNPDACVIRGGAWNFSARYLRSAARDGVFHGENHGNLGFRVCRTVIN